MTCRPSARTMSTAVLKPAPRLPTSGAVAVIALAVELSTISAAIRALTADHAQPLRVIRFQATLLRYRRLGALRRSGNDCRERVQIIRLRGVEQTRRPERPAAQVLYCRIRL
jgi:hypothetical protein